jgi:hypothetical protein
MLVPSFRQNVTASQLTSPISVESRIRMGRILSVVSWLLLSAALPGPEELLEADLTIYGMH